MSGWQVDDSRGELPEELHSLEAVFRLEGQPVTSDSLSDLILLERDGIRYYVKRYRLAGKGLRRYLGRSRMESEWRNLFYFRDWGIATAPVVAWGLERRAGLFHRGALVTREVANTRDLASLAEEGDSRLADRHWVDRISRQLAEMVRKFHDRGFTHNDLKWRNILVDDRDRLFLIDCPGGAFWWGPFLQYRKIKDLGCLDKMAKAHLSRSQRLRFYLYYSGHYRLTDADKGFIRKVRASETSRSARRPDS